MIAAGAALSVALTSDGAIVYWGDNWPPGNAAPRTWVNAAAIVQGWGQFEVPVALTPDGAVYSSSAPAATPVPSNLTNATALAAGDTHALALRFDKTVLAWGNNDFGQTNVPVGLTDVYAIAAGYGHSLALQSSGTVVAWGDNSFGQCSVPERLTDVIAISACAYHNLALRRNRTVVAWGATSASGDSLATPPNLTEVIAVAAGAAHGLALNSDGTVVAWGANFAGQTNVPAGLHDVRAIASGLWHCLALKSDGTVVAWGANAFHQSKPPPGLDHVIAIEAGGRTMSLAIVQETSGTPPEIVSTDGNLGFRAKQFGFNLSGWRGQWLAVETSPNLRDWLTVSTNLLNNGIAYFADSPSAAKHQFYRVRSIFP